MIYVFFFVVSFFGALSETFRKLGEKNIGNAGGPDSLIMPHIFGPALLISFVSGFAPYFAIAFMGFAFGWVTMLYTVPSFIISHFICGFVPYGARHILVFSSPVFIVSGLYGIWMYS